MLDMTMTNPDQYQTLLAEKQAKIEHDFANFATSLSGKQQTLPELEVFASEPEHFRLRAEFRIWHQDGRCFYAMFEPGKKKDPYEVTDFPIASKLINKLMVEMREAIHQPENDVLMQRMFQMEFLTTLSGDALITMIYHKPLGEEWQAAAEKLQAQIGFPIIGRSRKQKLVLERDYVIETLTIDGKQYHYKQIEGGFTQPNGGMNQKMLTWAKELSKPLDGDLVELYCGNGNFSIALAEHYNKVMATEISKTSVYAAQDNIEKNDIDNLIIARLSSEEFVQALQEVRAFRRLEGIDLKAYDFKTTLVDPPRSGLDDESVKQTQGYDNIIYISCNPETLHNNLQEFTKTHDIKRFALFDQFPYTHHIECGVFLQRKV
jgi:tRNA (uracil-5-)-methyltransferase